MSLLCLIRVIFFLRKKGKIFFNIIENIYNILRISD